MVAFQFLRAEHEIQLRADADSIEGVAERSGRQTPGELETAEAKEFHSGCDVARRFERHKGKGGQKRTANARMRHQVRKRRLKKCWRLLWKAKPKVLACADTCWSLLPNDGRSDERAIWIPQKTWGNFSGVDLMIAGVACHSFEPLLTQLHETLSDLNNDIFDVTNDQHSRFFIGGQQLPIPNRSMILNVWSVSTWGIQSKLYPEISWREGDSDFPESTKWVGEAHQVTHPPEFLGYTPPGICFVGDLLMFTMLNHDSTTIWEILFIAFSKHQTSKSKPPAWGVSIHTSILLRPIFWDASISWGVAFSSTICCSTTRYLSSLMSGRSKV